MKRAAQAPRLVALAMAGLLLGGCGQVIAVKPQPRVGLWSRMTTYWRQRRAEPARLGTASAAEAGHVRVVSSSFAAPLLRVWQNALSSTPGGAFQVQALDAQHEIEALWAGTADMAVTEVPLAPVQLREGKVPLLQVPVAAGSVCLVYNLPELGLPLKLNADVVAGLYLGEITAWDDPRVQAVNPNVELPNRDVITVHRQHPAGTTYIFTQYLASVSRQWAGLEHAQDDMPAWPTEGRSGAGDAGVIQAVMHAPGGIGYTECGYAAAHQAAVARLQNQAGEFAAPNAAGLEAVLASGQASLLVNNLQPVVNLPGPAEYPLTGMVYLVFPTGPKAPPAAGEMARWMLGPGQLLNEHAGFAPLPPALLRAAQLAAAPAAPPPGTVRAGAEPPAVDPVTVRH